MWRPNIQKTEIQKAIRSKKDLVFLDVETTGLSQNDFIIQFAALKYRHTNGGFKEIDKINVYIKPPILISKKIEELTGITNEFLADKPSEDIVVQEIEKFMRNSIPVIYNAPFDMRMLKALYSRNRMSLECDIVLDVLEMARDLVSKTDSSSHKLCDIAKLYGVDKDISFHDASGDIRATQKLFHIFMLEYFDKSKVCKNWLKKANVINLAYWEGYKGNSRIYVNTDRGSVYYSIKEKIWEDKNLRMEEYDMEDIRKQAFAIAGVSNETEFAKYRC